MTVRFNFLNNSATVAVFVVSLLLTAAALNSVVAAAGPFAPQVKVAAIGQTAVAEA